MKTVQSTIEKSLERVENKKASRHRDSMVFYFLYWIWEDREKSNFVIHTRQSMDVVFIWMLMW